MALAAMLVVLASGCGASSGVSPPGSADLANGKTVFVSKCGGCHQLADAGTQGKIGPDLDAAAVGVRLSGFKMSSFEAMVHNQIIEPDPFGKMPKDIVTGQDASDVSAYVASVAGLELAKQQRERAGGTTAPQ